MVRIGFVWTKILAAAFCGLFIFNGEQAEAQSFRITKFRVCSSYANQFCTEVPPPYEALDRRKFTAGRVHVALVLLCEQQALNFLTQREFLPVNVAVWVNGIRSPADIPIGITQEKWAEQGAKLTGVYAENGQFPWRTNFNMYLDREIRSLSVEIQDAQQQVVFNEGEPARLTLRFSN
jgi:hypothetical protein